MSTTYVVSHCRLRPQPFQGSITTTQPTGIPHEQIIHDRLRNKRPDGIAFKIPTKTRVGVICLLELKSPMYFMDPVQVFQYNINPGGMIITVYPMSGITISYVRM